MKLKPEIIDDNNY